MRSEEEELLKFFRCLEDIAADAGDNQDRSGQYTSDRIYDAIKEFRAQLRPIRLKKTLHKVT